jgi:hypothetical protein
MSAHDEFQEPNESFVNIGIDKIALGISSAYLNYRQSPDALKGIIDVVNWGNWSELNIQLEHDGLSHIDFYYPLRSVIFAVYQGISAGLFKEQLAYNLCDCIKGIYLGCYQPYNFIARFFDTGLFKLDEYELFFDFNGYNPFFKFDGNFKKYKGTIYTKDGKRKKRLNGKSKGRRRSILCFYDRGKKIGIESSLHRLEFRICDARAKSMLSPFDLFYSVPFFLTMHSTQIRQIVKRYIPADSISYDREYVEENAPELQKLIWLMSK